MFQQTNDGKNVMTCQPLMNKNVRPLANCFVLKKKKQHFWCVIENKSTPGHELPVIDYFPIIAQAVVPYSLLAALP